MTTQNKKNLDVVVPYNAEWPNHFKSIKNVLEAKVEDYITSIEHVGSTSIPGMIGKAIIDINIVMKKGTEFEYVINALEKLGYCHMGDQGIEAREAFKLISDENKILSKIKHHLYVCPHDSLELQRHLKFRNELIYDDSLRDEYNDIKEEILKRVGPSNRSAYVEMKQNNYQDFFDKVLGIIK